MSVELLLSPATHGGPKDPPRDEVALPAHNAWLRGEAPLAEMLEDPIVRMVMERDGLDKEQVRSAFLAAALRRNRRRTTRRSEA